ncbi:MAG: 2-oxo acid dehydrogenase subunit E2 [Sulfobacillus thermotolerans]|nr:2-oxo acid dehydrogenase subunit E2 [Sulfobacillus thermotolerans]
MKHPIVMPVLSDTMDTGRLTQWVRSVGDKVQKGEAVAEVETDKAVLEVEAFRDGYLAGPLAPVDQDIPVKQTIGFLADTAEEALDNAQTPTSPQRTEEAKILEAQASTPQVPMSTNLAPPSPSLTVVPTPDEGLPTDRQASPYARALAHDLGLDLKNIAPGADGIVHAAEVIAALLSPATPPLDYGPPYRIESPSKSRDAVARSMAATVSTPTFRVSARLPIREVQRQANIHQVSLTVALSKACAMTIQAYPRFNAAWTAQGLAVRDRVDIGIAVEAGDSLLTPVLRDMGEKSLAAIQTEWKALLERTKAARLLPPEYSGATFYLSNLGVYPIVKQFDAVVPLGASAILAIAAMDKEGTADCTLTCDHRVVFGADAAHFLTHLAGLLVSSDLWQ